MSHTAAPAPSPTPAAPLSGEQQAALAREFAATLDVLSARGRHDDAEALARQMVQLLPDEAIGWKTLAQGHLRRGDLAGALTPLSRAAALQPGDAELQRHRAAAVAMRDALALDAAGRYADAGRQYQIVLAQYPQHPEANHRFGVVAIRLGQPRAALPHLETAIGVNPHNGQFWVNYIDALLQSGQLKAAWIALEMGQQHGMQGPGVNELIGIMSAMSSDGVSVRRAPSPAGNPPLPAAPQNHGAGRADSAPAAPEGTPTKQEIGTLLDLCNSKQYETAEKRARAFVKRFPSNPTGWKVLSVAQFEQGRYDELLAHAQRARELAPGDIQVLQINAVVLGAQLRYKEAETACRQLLEVNPNHAEGVRLLAVMLLSLGRFDEAEQTFLRAGELAPRVTSVPAGLGSLYLQYGRLQDAAHQFRRALELDPANALNWSNLLFCLTHSEDVSPDELAAEHRRFGAHYDALHEADRLPHANAKDAGRPLRIGFVSADFRRHAVANFLEPVLPHLARQPGLLLYAYSSTPSADFVTERMRVHFAGWRNIFRVGDQEAVRQIRADGIDILIDLSGHTAENRLTLLAYKPAPIQASWIGYPGSTGLASVDYFLADRFWVPDETYARQFTEKIVRLPAVAPFLPEQIAPPINRLPALGKGYVTFGSFNRLDKIRRDVVALWARLMHAVPGSRMLIGAMPQDGSGEAKLAGWFGAEGIARERLDFRLRSATPVFLQQHHQVDFCLDTFPFGGLTTALHSLWMGVPTLTLPGKTVPGRSGATAMSHAGLAQFVATDADDFVRRGAALAGDLPALDALRSSMRERCRHSPMFRPDEIARGVGEALRAMWQRWCAGQPAEAFEIAAAQAEPTRDLVAKDTAPSARQCQEALNLYNTGRVTEAEETARQLATDFPDHPIGWKILGLSMYRLGRYSDETLAHLLRARDMVPDDLDLLQVLTALLETKRRHAEAEEAGRRLVELVPDHAEGQRLRGIALMSLWRFEEAEFACTRAVELTPESVLAWNALALLHMRIGRLAVAAKEFRRAIELGPEGESTWSNLMLCLQHDETVSPDELFAEHRRFGSHFETPRKKNWPRHPNSREPERVLRVGFISGDLCRHPVSNFLEPVLTHLARDESLALYAYSSTPHRDSTTVRLRGHFGHWREIYGAADADVAELVRTDGIDILIDLSGHTAHNRLLVLAGKPAPLQASWIGYPGTTGLTAVDYFIADRFWVPSDAFRAQFAEQIAYLPAVAPFQSEPDAPPVNALPALANGYVTFGSFNRVNKLRREVVSLWARLLRAVPDARLQIGAIPNTGSAASTLAGWFDEEGIARERLTFCERASVHEFLAQHHAIDICLDAFPFSGLTTVLQSLWMGVPTLTLPGRTVPGRSGAMAMSHAGLTQFVADSPDDFVHRGATLAADLTTLAGLRSGLRARCLASPMFQPETVAQSLSAALRIMWRRWCEGEPAESFSVGQTADQDRPEAYLEG
ncbi:hypothetical protein CY652_12770 [Burkholderia sp. WAC0059]|uniref:O-linked N-acetylglucosamine transferase family protein n=1 Tax=Burkholderia sp. WAC0059 TaxID=2066022 RepID=UPI000C7F4D74|nr:tetratricopeptide repeat protein [Burkholderia sp. WAC0059]PLZ01906.1 hypothetical protein CY652_12770 [Burkholderia sp. WAC0059]